MTGLTMLSCEFLPVTAFVSVEIPPTPAEWEAVWGAALYRVAWRSAAEEGTVDALVPAGESVDVSLPRTPPVVVRAVPVWTGGPAPGESRDDGPAAAAAIWPAGTSSGDRFGVGVRLPVLFEWGSAGDLLWRLLESGVDLRRFSVERLMNEIAERLPDDPWALDVDRVAAAIARGSMRASYIRSAPLHPVGLAAPDGIWFARSPFVAPIAGGARWPDAPKGITPFYSADGRRWIVEIDEAGRAWQAASP